MDAKHLPEQRRREVAELATLRRAQGRPPEDIAAEIVGIAGVTRLWAWRLAKGCRRSELLERLRRLGDPSVDESMLWRWEIGERDPSREHLDRLCQVYQTRPDLLGYGHDYSQPTPRPDRPAANGQQPATGGALAVSMLPGVMESEPLAMVQALTISTVSTETLVALECAMKRLEEAFETPAAPQLVRVLARQYHTVGEALEGRQRVEERRRLARVAARLSGQLGLLLWELDARMALAYFDAAHVAAEESGDPALITWVADCRPAGFGKGSRQSQATALGPE